MRSRESLGRPFVLALALLGCNGGGGAGDDTHYGALVDGRFAGDASRVVFGFCIEPGCSPVATQPEARDVIEMFDAWYPGNGGIFFWAHPDDTGAWFSEPFRAYYDATACAP